MIPLPIAARISTVVGGVAWSTGAAVAAFVVLAGCEGVGTDGPRGTDSDTVAAASSGDSILAARPVDSPPPAQDAEVPSTASLRAALEERLRGPSTEREAGDDPSGAGGAPSMFKAETADALRSVSVDSTGHATVDFHDLRPLMPNASSSAGSAVLLDELNATVFGVPDIRSVEYRMDGSCDLFWEWLQYECQTVTRESAAP